MKKLILVSYALVLMTSAFSQQERQVSHYMYDQISMNPGSAGSDDMISTNAILRQQWTGFEGGPTTYVFNLSAPFKLGTTKHGVGLAIAQDALGFYRDRSISLSYAYRFSVGNGTLGVGVAGSFYNRNLNPEWRPVESGPDIDLPYGTQNEMTFDMNVGLLYTTEELYVGVSSTRLLQSSFEMTSGSGGSFKEDQLARHYCVTAGYNLPLANPLFEFRPSFFLNTDTKLTRIDVNATLMYNKKFWGGVSYRVGSAIVGMVGLTILNGVRVGYAYDFDTSDMMRFSKGGHEILLGYSFRVGVEKAPQKYKSIRYL